MRLLRHDLRTGFEIIRKERAEASSAPGGTDRRFALFAVDDMTTGNWTISIPVSGIINNLWNATWSQKGGNLSASGVNWNQTLAPGALAEFGFCASR